MEDKIIKFPFTLTCACGEMWHMNVPKRFRTKEFHASVIRDWNKKHSEHLNSENKNGSKINN